jgi:hypothetical protein
MPDEIVDLVLEHLPVMGVNVMADVAKLEQRTGSFKGASLTG